MTASPLFKPPKSVSQALTSGTPYFPIYVFHQFLQVTDLIIEGVRKSTWPRRKLGSLGMR